VSGRKLRIAKVCSASIHWSKAGNAADVASTTAKRGTSESSVVYVSPAATWKQRSSKMRRTTATQNAAEVRQLEDRGSDMVNL